MASSLNKVQIIGNLTRDPEIKQTTNGQSVCTVGVATNRTWKDQSGEKKEQVEYHTIVAWGKLAEICGQYLKKGQKAYFDGRLQTRDWEGPDGVKKYRTEIVAENMIMLGGRGGEGGGNSFGADVDYSASAPSVSDDPSRASNSNDEIRIEDIPF